MQKEKKASYPVSIRMDASLHERLKEFCDRSGQSKTTAIERALRQYIDEYDAMIKRAEKQQ